MLLEYSLKCIFFLVLNYDSVTVCDGILKQIQCPNNENIHVLQGFYGKWRNHDCHGENIDPDNLPTCREDRSKTTRIVKDLCQGKNTCTLISDKSIYGEPCPDNKAYLYMTFFCMRNGQKLVHQRTMNNQEVVTVPSHGFIVHEEKTYLEEERRKKEEEALKKQTMISLGSPLALNPNPIPEGELEKQKAESNTHKKSSETVLNFKNDEKIDLTALDLALFNRPDEDNNKVENLKTQDVQQEKAETRKLQTTNEARPVNKTEEKTNISNQTDTQSANTQEKSDYNKIKVQQLYPAEEPSKKHAKISDTNNSTANVTRETSDAANTTALVNPSNSTTNASAALNNSNSSDGNFTQAINNNNETKSISENFSNKLQPEKEKEANEKPQTKSELPKRKNIICFCFHNKNIC